MPNDSKPADSTRPNLKSALEPRSNAESSEGKRKSPPKPNYERDLIHKTRIDEAIDQLNNALRLASDVGITFNIEHSIMPIPDKPEDTYVVFSANVFRKL